MSLEATPPFYFAALPPPTLRVSRDFRAMTPIDFAFILPRLFFYFSLLRFFAMPMLPRCHQLLHVALIVTPYVCYFADICRR